jgi:drug/metabolite transporter (DMT)-like permease
MQTNTKKAVIFMNIYHLVNFGYMVTAKTVMNSGVLPFDLMMVRSLVSIVHCGTIMWCNGIELIGEEVRGNKDNCRGLLIRSCVGTIGFSCYVFAILKLPLGICMIIFNTGPFWASLLGWFVNNESLSWVEILCMILSFGGIAMISMSKSVDPLAEENEIVA